MTYPLPLQPSTALKQRLLTGASAAVIVLAMSVAVPTGALAQELNGTDGDATNIADVGVVTNNAGAGDFGAIDTDTDVAAGVNPTSISLANSATISITDSDVTSTDTSTVAGDFVIATGATGTLIFAEADDNTNRVDGNAAVLTIAGNLNGGDTATAGGTLAINVRDGVDQDESAFNVLGSTNMAVIAVEAGGAETADNGGNIAATFGDDASVDNFSLSSTLDVSGGDTTTAGTTGSGGDSSVTVNANTLSIVGTTTVTGTVAEVGQTGATGGDGGDASLAINIGGTGTFEDVTLGAGDGGAGLADDAAGIGGEGGDVSFTLSGGTSTAEVLTITAGDGGAGGNTTGGGNTGGNGGAGGDASATIAADTTLTVTGDVSVVGGGVGAAGTGAGTNGVGGAGGDASLTIAGSLIAGDALTDAVTVDGTGVIIQDGGSLTIAGVVSDSSNNDVAAGTIAINDGGSLTFNGGGAQTVDEVDVNGPGTINFSGAGTAVTFSDLTVGGLSTVATDEIGAMVFSDGADAVFDADTTVDVNDITLGADSTATFAEATTVSGDVSGTGGIIVDTNNNTLTFDGGTTAQTVATPITFDTGGEGIVVTDNTAGLTFESDIGAATEAAEDIQIGTSNIVTFNGQIFANAFTLAAVDPTVPEVDTQLTFNATEAVQATVGGTLTLDDSTITLGSNVGGGDTVFDLTGNAGDDLDVTGVTDNVLINLAANFLEGTGATAIALVDDTADIATDDDVFAVTDTALTDFSVFQADDTGTASATGENIVIAASARTAQQTADLLGVSVQDATALRQAVLSTDGLPDQEGLDALTAVLNAGVNSPTAATAARTVGTQESTLGGGAETAFLLFSDQARTLSGRLERSRGQSGFSGGDLPGQYSPQADVMAAPAPTSMGGFWGQAFGGVADADGDRLADGYDASYGGLMVGVDGNVSEDFTIGAFGSYSFSNVDGDGAANAEIDANTFGLGVYAGYAGEGFYLDGFAAYAMSDNDLTRTAVIGGVTRNLSANYDASQFSVGAAGGVPFEMSSNVFITPNASLTYNHYDADSYTETGIGALPQRVNPGSVSNLTGTIGARIHAVYANFDNDGTVFIPELRVGIVGDLMDDDATASVNFLGGGATYQVTGTDTDDVGALIGFGLGLDNSDWAASLSYDADIRSDFMSHTARAEFRWKF